MKNALRIDTPIAYSDLRQNLGRQLEEVELTIGGNTYKAFTSSALTVALMLAPKTGRAVGKLVMADDALQLRDQDNQLMLTVNYAEIERVEVGVLQSLSRYSAAVLPYRHYWTFLEMQLVDQRVLQFVNADVAAAPRLLAALAEKRVPTIADPFELIGLAGDDLTHHLERRYEEISKSSGYPVTVAGLGN